MRMPFKSIFTVIEGKIIPRFHISIGDVSVASGTAVAPTLKISDIAVGKLTNYDLLVEIEDGLTMIRGYYGERDAAAA